MEETTDDLTESITLENNEEIANNQDKNKNISNGFIVTEVRDNESNTANNQNYCIGPNPGEIHLV